MKRLAFLLFLVGSFVPLASAQDGEHVQVGVFADYFRLSQTDNNFGGVGASVSFQAFREIKLEGEMSYASTKPSPRASRIPAPVR